MARENSHLGYIDGLRGVAVLMVMCRHYYMATYHVGLPRWADSFGLGYLGVHLFLILSGFCIAWAYVGPGARNFKITEFARRRIERIVPPYYVALAISITLWIAANGPAPEAVAAQLVTHLTMTHNLFTTTVVALNGPFWSLALESQLYLCFPVLLFGFRRWGALPVLALVLTVQTAFRVFALRYGTGYTDDTFVIPWSVLGRVFEFALGVWAAHLASHATISRFGTTGRLLLGVATMALAGAAWIAKSRLGVTHPLTDLCWTGAFFCVLVCAAPKEGLLHRALASGPITALGSMCYSTYLIHALVLNSVASALLGFSGGRWPLVLMPVAIALTLVPCYIFYRLVERPCIEHFRNARRGAAHPES